MDMLAGPLFTMTCHAAVSILVCKFFIFYFFALLEDKLLKSQMLTRKDMDKILTAWFQSLRPT